MSTKLRSTCPRHL